MAHNICMILGNLQIVLNNHYSLDLTPISTLDVPNDADISMADNKLPR
jgi:hypothetical protein